MTFKNKKQVLVTLFTMLLASSFTLVEAKKKFSDEELTKFIYGNSSVYQLQLAAKQQFAAAKTKEQQQQIANNFQSRSVQLVQKSGLSLDKYNTIATDLQSNEDLQKRVNSLVEDLQKKASKK